MLGDAFGTGLSYLWKTQVLCRTDVVERLWRDESRRRQVLGQHGGVGTAEGTENWSAEGRNPKLVTRTGW